MKHRRISLALKLNILMASIVIIVSAILITISYNMYKQTAYEPIYERMNYIQQDYDVLLNEKYDFDMIVSDMNAICAIPSLEGYQEVIDEIKKTGNKDLWEKWLDSWALNIESISFMKREDYDKLCDELVQKARAEGIEFNFYDELEEWVASGESGFPKDLLKYESYVGSSVYYSFACNNITMGSKAGASTIEGYVKNKSGEYTKLFEIFTEKTLLDNVTIEGYIKVSEIKIIDEYEKQSEHKAFLTKDDEIVEVIKLEQSKEPFYVIFKYDTSEIQRGQKLFLWRNILLVGILVIVSITISLSILWKMATNPLRTLAHAVNKINVGQDYFEKNLPDLNITSNDEIGDLYRNICSMQTRIVESTDSLTKMTAEKERISTELTLATRIQAAMLPSIFPPFPEYDEFDIYASMTPAKEVGGDFYDFFIVDDDHLALVIADVSGKGVPAALFMMISKLLVKNHTTAGLSPAAVLDKVNHQICSNNREEMFITLWIGILEISSGKLVAANAGHEYPIFKEPDGNFKLFKDIHGFVVGGIDGAKYKEYEMTLKPGTKLFVYTDGLLEATKEYNEQYGVERLLNTLNETPDCSPEDLIKQVRSSVDSFVGNGTQFDDLTMLCLEYKGKKQQ